MQSRKHLFPTTTLKNGARNSPLHINHMEREMSKEMFIKDVHRDDGEKIGEIHRDAEGLYCAQDNEGNFIDTAISATSAEVALHLWYRNQP